MAEELRTNPIVRAAKWVLGEVWEKVNVVAMWRELKALGRQHGKRFFWAALIWECIEDILFPFLSWLAGVPELIPLFLVMHFEPIVYPAFFWAFRQWDRRKGLIPEHPERPNHSASWRSWAKTLNYNVTSLGFLGFMLVTQTDYKNNGMVLTYGFLMTLFGYVHERIWHDSNYGIRPDDTVETRRNIAKSATHLVVAVMVMYPLMKAFMGTVPWTFLLLWQVGAALVYFGLETVWSKSLWGLQQTPVLPSPAPLIRSMAGTRLNYGEVGRQLFPVQSMPEAAEPIFDREPEDGGKG